MNVRQLMILGLTCAMTSSLMADPKPRVLLLGDSISIGYTKPVQQKLADEAIVIRPMRGERAENCSGTTYGVDQIERWLQLGNGKWDVIHFNFGLHDLKRVDPDTAAASTDPTHPRQAEPEVYEKHLRSIVKQLKTSGSKLIFATTTPVPEGDLNPHRDVNDVARYNAIAQKIMEEEGVAINDLYSFALPRLKEIQRPANVHFTPAGSAALAERVVTSIREHLAQVNLDADRPNIIFFLSDDQRDDLMGCAGHSILKTPTMDHLATRGTRFTNMFVTTSICAASRATLLTGLYERTHKFTFRTPPIAKEFCETSYPVLLKQAGYKSGFVGKFGVGVPRGMQQEMFDTFVPLNRNPYFKKQPDGTTRHLTDITGDHSIAFLKQQKRGEPFCLSVSFNAPHAEDGDKENHYPWPPSMDGLYDDVTIPPPALSDPAIYESQPEFLQKSFNRVRWFWRWDTPEKWQKNVKGYYRMLSGLDAVMGRVLKELDDLGLADNTVIIFAGDNGYYLGSRGLAGKWSHYEESLRVPLIIADPRVSDQHRNRTDDRIVLNVDIAPTILDLAGVKIPERYQGHSLMPLVRGESPADWREDFFCEHLMEIDERIPKWEGVRGTRYVYAKYFKQEPPYEFLHDLKVDPKQLKNFASDPDYAEVLKEQRARCIELRDQLGGPYSRGKFPIMGDN